MKGEVIKDSVFNGIVKYFDKSKNFAGFSTFEYGLQDGPSVKYFQSGNKSDSINYKNGLENGDAYKYDSLGHLIYKTYYFNGLAVGGVTKYSSQGKVQEDYFTNFERKIIYDIKALSDSLYEEKGEEINASIYNRSEGLKNNNILFLYLIKLPFVKTHFELAICDRYKKILSSIRIETDSFFYERIIEDLTDGNKYGVVFHKFNKYKQRDDVEIKLIELYS